MTGLLSILGLEPPKERDPIWQSQDGEFLLYSIKGDKGSKIQVASKNDRRLTITEAQGFGEALMVWYANQEGEVDEGLT